MASIPSINELDANSLELLSTRLKTAQEQVGNVIKDLRNQGADNASGPILLPLTHSMSYLNAASMCIDLALKSNESIISFNELLTRVFRKNH